MENVHEFLRSVCAYPQINSKPVRTVAFDSINILARNTHTHKHFVVFGSIFHLVCWCALVTSTTTVHECMASWARWYVWACHFALVSHVASIRAESLSFDIVSVVGCGDLPVIFEFDGRITALSLSTSNCTLQWACLLRALRIHVVFAAHVRLRAKMEELECHCGTIEHTK